MSTSEAKLQRKTTISRSFGCFAQLDDNGTSFNNNCSPTAKQLHTSCHKVFFNCSRLLALNRPNSTGCCLHRCFCCWFSLWSKRSETCVQSRPTGWWRFRSNERQIIKISIWRSQSDFSVEPEKVNSDWVLITVFEQITCTAKIHSKMLKVRGFDYSDYRVKVEHSKNEFLCSSSS